MPIEVQVIVRGADTGGAYAVLELRAARPLRLPDHVLPDHDVDLHVLAGTVTVDGRAHRAGAHAPMPRGIVRSLAAAAGSRAVALIRPCGLERLGWLAEATDPDDRAALLAAAGVTLIR